MSFVVSWRLVPGYPGFRASTLGTVETQWVNGTDADRKGRRGPNPLVRGTRWVAVRKWRAVGRWMSSVTPEASPTGKRIQYFIHTFVCLAFHGEPLPGQEVCHFPDEDVDNNRPDNLRWGTRRENMMDRVFHGTSNRGERCGSVKMTEQVVHTIRHHKERGLGPAAISRLVGYHVKTVASVYYGDTWYWLTTPPSDVSVADRSSTD